MFLVLLSIFFDGKGGIDSNRLRVILIPTGCTACVQNANEFCRTGFDPGPATPVLIPAGRVSGYCKHESD